ncbi:MAG TPA: SPFH domain-containing protein, partial [Polyangiaceae bacterium LLY-WYZ-14_1]|nr:SPFH domain-containing protein [Polyangiaceae bacterium LLY-WYZ-14_1]
MQPNFPGADNLPGLGEPIPPESAGGLGALGDVIVVVGVAGVLFAGFILLVFGIVSRLLYVARPNEALIFSGKSYTTEDGRRLGFKVVTGGKRAFRIPVIERVDRLDMSLIPIDIRVVNAYSRGNIPLQIHAIANVKIHSDAFYLRNAIERFLGRSRQEIQAVAQQTLEGALREVLAQLTPEEVNEDRLKFAANLISASEDDLQKLGLALDTLKIQHVSDEVEYLDSLGRPRIAQAKRDAENAENEAAREVIGAQAQADRIAETAKAQAEAAVLSKQNELRRIQAELEGEAQAVEREAEAAAKTARALAERTLQQIRDELENKRLQAEVVIPAEAQQKAQELLAKGDAAPTAENGRASAMVLDMMSEAWQSMGSDAKEIYVVQHLEEILGTVIDNLRNVQVGEVSVLDQGDGTGLATYAATYPQMVASVLRALGESTGVDVPALLASDGRGRN